MGSAESGAGEFSVGSIVWVRRRNGSWWPGKIVGPEELSASHLTSPRSGTPVKLLGREDASVDWYNLEKSKRVKAFRCGDFDACIKKAECSEGMPIKKREKYARREDAIFHALELEREQFRKQGKSGLASDSTNHKLSGDAVKKGMVTPTERLGKNHVKFGNSKSNQIYKRLEVTPKTEILESTLYSKKPKEGNHLSGEDSEVTPRMRGLQDFGLKIAPSQTTLSSFGASNGSRKPIADNSVEAPFSGGGPKIGSTSHMNGVLEPVGAICRAKRSRCVYLPADSSESLDYKAISQSDIEMSDSQTEPFLHHTSLIGENISGSCEDESDTSESESTESECDSSETEDIDEEMAGHSDTAVPMEPYSSIGRYGAREHGSMGHDDPEESMLSGDMPHFYYPSSSHEAVSKWQLKGKRNTRTLTKRSADATDGKRYMYRSYREDKDFRGDMIGLDNGYSSSRAVYKSRNLVEWDDWSWEDNHRRPSSRGYSDHHQSHGRPKSMLIDVELKVKSSYQKEPVPIVSMMSKLNGKAIIGHPIQIEPLEDGSTNTLLSMFDDYGNELTENDGNNSTLPQAWRTARRTANSRVPRLDEAAYDYPFLDRENRPPSKKSNFGGQKGSLVVQSSSDRKHKKAPKRASLSNSSSQKTRTLSSIAIEHKFSNSDKLVHDTSCGINQVDDGSVMKPDSSGGPTTVSCIPVKLVFSRLLEKINRPASKAVVSSAPVTTLLNSEEERNR